jgi:hypothetical protein
MKNLFLPLIFLFLLTSCTSAFEKDVRRMAILTCEIQKLSIKAIRGDEGAEIELAKKEKEAEELEQEMIKKYSDKKDDKEMQQKSNEIFEEELKKCMKEK